MFSYLNVFFKFYFFVIKGGPKVLTHVFLFRKIFTFPVFLAFRGARILNKDRIRYSKVGLIFSKVKEKCGNFDDFQKFGFLSNL